MPSPTRRALPLGVAFRSGSMYDFAGLPQPYMRLGFTFHTEAELAEAVRRMAAALPVASALPVIPSAARNLARVAPTAAATVGA